MQNTDAYHFHRPCRVPAAIQPLALLGLDQSTIYKLQTIQTISNIPPVVDELVLVLVLPKVAQLQAHELGRVPVLDLVDQLENLSIFCILFPIIVLFSYTWQLFWFLRIEFNRTVAFMSCCQYWIIILTTKCVFGSWFQWHIWLAILVLLLKIILYNDTFRLWLYFY